MSFPEADLAVMLRGSVKLSAMIARRVPNGVELSAIIRPSEQPAPAPAEPEPKLSFPAKPYDAAADLCCQLHAIGLPAPMTEFRFHPKRRWRADACWPEYMLMLEIDGGVWTKGRHTRGKGFIADQEKRNEATLMGFRVLNCIPQDVRAGRALTLIERALKP